MIDVTKICDALEGLNFSELADMYFSNGHRIMVTGKDGVTGLNCPTAQQLFRLAFEVTVEALINEATAESGGLMAKYTDGNVKLFYKVTLPSYND